MIELIRRGAVAWVTIRRADKKNAMSEAMWAQLLPQAEAACPGRWF